MLIFYHTASIALIFLFWISLGLTEGWKWRKDKGRPDTNRLINFRNYHVWRAATNFSFLVFPVLAFLIGNSDPDPTYYRLLFDVLTLNIMAWIAYERFMTYAIWDDFMKTKEDFHILGKFFKRPPAIWEIVIMVSTLSLMVIKYILVNIF